MLRSSTPLRLLYPDVPDLRDQKQTFDLNLTLGPDSYSPDLILHVRPELHQLDLTLTLDLDLNLTLDLDLNLTLNLDLNLTLDLDLNLTLDLKTQQSWTRSTLARLSLRPM